MRFLHIVLSSLALIGSAPPKTAAAEKPNIVYILADDLGYGDLGCYNKDSKIPTPNLDRLAKEGMRFTDAHAPSSVCSPSRYGILTGRYAWRSRLQRGVLLPYDRPLIDAGRLTVPTMLKQQGYTTACVGKWHLGWDWPKPGPDGKRDFTQAVRQWADHPRLRLVFRHRRAQLPTLLLRRERSHRRLADSADNGRSRRLQSSRRDAAWLETRRYLARVGKTRRTDG